MLSLQNVQPLRKRLPLKWRRGKDLSFGVKYAPAVVLKGKVYIGGTLASWGRNEYDVMEYDIKNEECAARITSKVRSFGMASVNDQLVLAGGEKESTEIQVWDHRWMIDHYPRMPSGRSNPAALSYQNYLIVVWGGNIADQVDILDCSTHKWYSAQSVPVGGGYLTSAVVSEYIFISAYQWQDGLSHVFSAHLPTLISKVTSAGSHAANFQLWKELPSPPVLAPTLLALQNHLLLVGGYGKRKELHCYDPESNKWIVCGELPMGMSATSCAVLPSGELFVAGGAVEGDIGNSKQVWIGAWE